MPTGVNPHSRLTTPFEQLQDVYWSSITSVYEADWACALYLDKGALGVGHKPFAGSRCGPYAMLLVRPSCGQSKSPAHKCVRGLDPAPSTV